VLLFLIMLVSASSINEPYCRIFGDPRNLALKIETLVVTKSAARLSKSVWSHHHTRESDLNSSEILKSFIIQDQGSRSVVIIGSIVIYGHFTTLSVAWTV
jgi:hypothetical protein